MRSRLCGAEGATIIEIAESTLNALAQQEILLAETELAVEDGRRWLKARRDYLWLAADGSGPNPAIDGKNAEIRAAQHGTICNADPEVQRIALDLRAAEATVRKLAAAIRASKRAYGLALELLHTRRAEMYVASGRFQPENHLPGTSELAKPEPDSIAF